MAFGKWKGLFWDLGTGNGSVWPHGLSPGRTVGTQAAQMEQGEKNWIYPRARVVVRLHGWSSGPSPAPNFMKFLLEAFFTKIKRSPKLHVDRITRSMISREVVVF